MSVHKLLGSLHIENLKDMVLMKYCRFYEICSLHSHTEAIPRSVSPFKLTPGLGLTKHWDHILGGCTTWLKADCLCSGYYVLWHTTVLINHGYLKTCIFSKIFSVQSMTIVYVGHWESGFNQFYLQALPFTVNNQTHQSSGDVVISEYKQGIPK